MPQLDLTELECKVGWIILDDDVRYGRPFSDPALYDAERSLFEKFYRAFRGMPPREAA